MNECRAVFGTLRSASMVSHSDNRRICGFLQSPNLLLQTSHIPETIRSIEIIGEAAKNIPDDLKKKYPEIPWRGMAGTRSFMDILEWMTIKKYQPNYLLEHIDYRLSLIRI